MLTVGGVPVQQSGGVSRAEASNAVAALRAKAGVLEDSLQPGLNLKLYRDVASKMAQVSGLI